MCSSRSLSSYADHFPASCGALEALVDFVYANKACSVDGDCVHAGACTEIREHCSGGFYVNAQHDPAKLAALSQGASSCLIESPCCGTLPFACALKAGCVGTLACDLAEATFPCRNQVDQAGGPKSAAADKYRRSNAGAAYLGCKVACGKP